MRRLEGKVIAVAGGAGGIGSELVQVFAREGASVLAGDIDLAAAQAVVDEVKAAGGTAAAEALDITQAESIERFVARAGEVFGGLDGLHANAASFKYANADVDIVDIELEVFDHVMEANARGHALCARYAIPSMLKRGGGVLLFTSSGAAYAPDVGRVAYSMSKSAIHALMRHIAVRWGREGVRANVIAPGVILHPALEEKAPFLRGWAEKRVSTPYVGEPRDIAAMAALLMSDEGRYITGQVISVDGGSTMRA